MNQKLHNHTTRSPAGRCAKRWIATALIAATILGLTTSVRGGRTAPVPPGTILFEGPGNLGSNNWYGAQRGMKADGSGKATAFNHWFYAKPLPSAQVYGTNPIVDRLWITLDEVQPAVPGVSPAVYELFACRVDDAGNLEKLQLTALHPQVTIAHPGFHPDVHFSWSNDGLDSFVSFRGRTYGTDTAMTPAALQDTSDDRVELFRLNLSGAEIELAFEAGIDPLISAADFASGAIESVLGTSDLSIGAAAYHHWSPDGNKIAYVMSDGLWVADIAAGPVAHGSVQTSRIFGSCRFPQWSPDGQRIALGENGTLWTVSPTGTGVVRVLARTNSDAYAVPVWSPDGQHLAIVHRRMKGLTAEYFVSRVASSGGTVTILTKDMDPAAEKRPTGWYLNAPANP